MGSRDRSAVNADEPMRSYRQLAACHDDHWYDGEARDQGHWHNGPWDQNWH